MRLLVLPESVTPAEGDADPDREDEPEGEAPAPPSAERSARLGGAAAGIAEAQAWKGQQIAKGWGKFVHALRRPKAQI